ncbi:MAG: carbonic anhydrase [Candidatus Aenigmatarchaeota archaeon]
MSFKQGTKNNKIEGMSSASPVKNFRIPLKGELRNGTDSNKAHEYLIRNNWFFDNYVPTFKNFENGQKPLFVSLVPLIDEKSGNLISCSPNYIFCQGIGQNFYVTKFYSKNRDYLKFDDRNLHIYSKASLLYALNHLGSEIVLNFYPRSYIDYTNILLTDEKLILSIINSQKLSRVVSVINAFYDMVNHSVEFVPIKLLPHHEEIYDELNKNAKLFQNNFYVRMSSYYHVRPSTFIFTCSDSRVVPELFLDLPLNEAVIMRLAGNITNFYGKSHIDNSFIENAVISISKSEIKDIFLIGHTKCGAVMAATNLSEEEINKEVEELSKVLLALKKQLRDSDNGGIVRTIQSILKRNDYSFINLALQYLNLYRIISVTEPDIIKNTTIYAFMYDIQHGLVSDYTDNMKQLLNLE